MTDEETINPRSRVRTFIRSFGTNSQAAHVETDQGEYVIKAVNNRDGPPVLVAEWIGSMAAKRLGLLVPDFAVVELPNTVDIPLSAGGSKFFQPGLCFGSKFTQAFGWDGDNEALAAVENLEAIPAIVTLDTWLRNLDRFCRDDKGIPRFNNPGNLLLQTKEASKGKFNIVAIDFGYALGGPGQSRRKLKTLPIIEDNTIYGCFPAFRPYMLRAKLTPVLEQLRSFSRDDVEGILAGIPTEWELPASERIAIIDFLCNRARYVADKFKCMIWEDDSLWGAVGT